MIIQTGMRTDIPAFYSKWFLNRIREGYLICHLQNNEMRGNDIWQKKMLYSKKVTGNPWSQQTDVLSNPEMAALLTSLAKTMK